MITPAKILIRSPNWVGDVVMATPAFRLIRSHFPDSRISILLKPYVKLILKDSPWFDEFIEYGSGIKPLGKGCCRYWKLLNNLKNEQFDLGFVLPNSLSSAFMFWYAGVKKRVGYLRDSRGWMLTDGLDRKRENGKFLPTYMADYYLELCYRMGCSKSSNNLELFFSNEDEERLNVVLSKYNIPENRKTVLINPGAAYGSSKCWTINGFAETVDGLNERFDCNIILVSGKNEIDLANSIEKQCKSNIYNLANENITLDLLKPLIKKSSLLLTVDSGPRHFAVAFKIPTVVLMGPTDPRYTVTPWEIGTVISDELSCGPCHKKTCPTDHQCMENITSQQVIEACSVVLGKSG